MLSSSVVVVFAVVEEKGGIWECLDRFLSVCFCWVVVVFECMSRRKLSVSGVGVL